MAEERRSLPKGAVLRLLLVGIGIITGVTLVYVSAGIDIVFFGQDVSLALPMVIIYIAGMLVGRFGGGQR